MARPFAQVMYEARRLVAHTNRDFAKLTGVSVRTVERHTANGGVSSPFQTMRVVAALYEKNPELAKELAQVGGVNIKDVESSVQEPRPPSGMQTLPLPEPLLLEPLDARPLVDAGEVPPDPLVDADELPPAVPTPLAEAQAANQATTDAQASNRRLMAAPIHTRRSRVLSTRQHAGRTGGDRRAN